MTPPRQVPYVASPKTRHDVREWFARVRGERG